MKTQTPTLSRKRHRLLSKWEYRNLSSGERVYHFLLENGPCTTEKLRNSLGIGDIVKATLGMSSNGLLEWCGKGKGKKLAINIRTSYVRMERELRISTENIVRNIVSTKNCTIEKLSSKIGVPVEAISRKISSMVEDNLLRRDQNGVLEIPSRAVESLTKAGISF